jgi:hypothetical protein
MPLWTVLAISGFVCLGIGRLALYQLMPKLRTRERRGLLPRPTPEPEDSRWAAARLLWLIWTVETPANAPRYRRHVMMVRWFPVLGLGLMVASVFALQAGARHQASSDTNRPPQVSVAIGGDTEPVVP